MFTRALIITAAWSLCLGLLPVSAGEPAAAKDDAGKDAGGAVASASRVSGTVEFCRAGSAEFAALAQDGSLFKGDTVRTGKKSSVELKLADQSHLSLGEETALVIRDVRGQAQSDRTLLDLDEGQLGASVEKLGERQRFEISTPVAVCGVRGTRFALSHTDPKGGRTDKNRGKTLLTVGHGKVNADCRNPLVGGKGGVDVEKGKSVVITWDGIGKLGDVGIGHFKSLTKTLPGWHPDPADPNLAKLQVFLPGKDAGGIGSWWNRGGQKGPGAYDLGGRGFSNGVQNAILGNLGLTGSGSSGGSSSGRDDGWQNGAAGGTTGAGFTGADPVLPGLVRPGQPVSPPAPIVEDVVD